MGQINLILVEGSNDKFILIELIKRRLNSIINNPSQADHDKALIIKHNDTRLRIEQSGSKEKAIHDLKFIFSGFNDSQQQTHDKISIIEELRVRLMQQDDENDDIVIGLILDADKDAQKTYAQVHTILAEKYPDVVPILPVEGLVLHAVDQPRIGVWIMPNNRDQGTIEDFFISLIRPDDALWQEVQHTISAVRKKADLTSLMFTEKDLRKAQIFTWLAWQKNPVVQMSKAIERNHAALNLNCEPVELFINWLTRLFDLPDSA
ncbi:MAG TPA: hypothetical protein DEF47_03150 [Herpetosiphon sp.]|uniref:DUF4276 family protein n=1 Tax=Herpetosiphon aurantiacus (strain ATCC 23779 / DSM 785 / 114-95) TaxID=316274 RepID=A9B698_HERA2|nr:DUF3226 domain-containing protein [Herpetosiphon sp.]ABX06309.1 hypothetical protein Haur_3673 [Herpetosiphon aurantiacus DSM 785]HBW48889.1 hypothetical protein [Herpetosiphon sp.]